MSGVALYHPLAELDGSTPKKSTTKDTKGHTKKVPLLLLITLLADFDLGFGTQALG